MLHKYSSLSYHPPNGVESSCEGSVMPGGLGTAKEKGTDSSSHSSYTSQSLSFDTALD